ncbi:MAG: phage neck terminator protein [Lachnospiraceae bacterium]
MRLEDLKEYTYTLVHSYFQHAIITWAEEISTKKKPPQITLELNNLTRSTHPIDEQYSEDEVIRYYPSTIMLTMNTYIIGAGDTLESPSNTAVADLNEFWNYIDSPEMVDVLCQAGLSFSVSMPIQGVPKLLGTSDYEYRAMATFQIDFTQAICGMYSLGHPSSVPVFDTETEAWVDPVPVPQEEWKPTATGGGSYDLANAPQLMFEMIELEERNEEE